MAFMAASMIKYCVNHGRRLDVDVADFFELKVLFAYFVIKKHKLTFIVVKY